MHPQIFSAVVTRKSVRRCASSPTRAVRGRGGRGRSHRLRAAASDADRRADDGVAGPPARRRRSAAEIPVPESHSAQVLRYVVALPRAVQLHYQVACPSAEREGTIGETFDNYRTRRLAELERERQAQANLIGAVVGAVAPPVRGGRRRRGPGRIGGGDGRDQSGRRRRGRRARVAARRQPAARATRAPRSCAAPWSWARRRRAGAR